MVKRIDIISDPLTTPETAEVLRCSKPTEKELPTSGEFASLNRLIQARYPALAATDQKRMRPVLERVRISIFRTPRRCSKSEGRQRHVG